MPTRAVEGYAVVDIAANRIALNLGKDGGYQTRLRQHSTDICDDKAVGEAFVGDD